MYTRQTILQFQHLPKPQNAEHTNLTGVYSLWRGLYVSVLYSVLIARCHLSAHNPILHACFLFFLPTGVAVHRT